MKQEKWTRREWSYCIAMLIIFFPIGMAMLLRKWSGEEVFKDRNLL